MSSRFRIDHDNTRSDGMCGRVTVVDTETGESESQHWSVTSPEAQSQHAAYEMCVRRLTLGTVGT